MSDLRKRLLFVFMAIIVYRIGTYIPVPGINPEALSSFFEEQSGTIIDMFNMFSGGAPPENILNISIIVPLCSSKKDDNASGFIPGTGIYVPIL